MISIYAVCALSLFADEAFEPSVNFRTIALGLDNVDGDKTDLVSQSLLRLIMDGRPTGELVYEIHGVQSLTSFSSNVGIGNPNSSFVASGSRFQALDARWDWHRGDETEASFIVDRLNLRVSFPAIDITLGRQAITFGKAYFWNPLDIYLPFDPRQFDRDYKPGVDALRIDVPIGDFTGLNLIAATGGELAVTGEFLNEKSDFNTSWYGSSVLVRGYTTVSEWDLAFQTGKVYGGYQSGGAASGEVGKLSLRLEAAYLAAQDSPALPLGLRGDLVEDHLQAVVGIGHRFESSLDLEAEYFFNGAGEDEDLNAALLRFNTGGALNLSRHLAGVTASYEIMPILIGRLVALVSLTDQSAQIQPGFTLSVSDETDFLIGASLNVGDRPRQSLGPLPEVRSEFGSQPNVLYMELKIYF
ncbi:MAG: hypothetical protein QF473_23190 [Planctomycetota bacterium]|jgi:hypothetical protein|nr:hypothetical protein [Planctomycetota bacterium]MDP6502067.1 hypothetical protein [Planctomycetota bacterium]